MVSENIVKLRDYLRVIVGEPQEAYAYLDEIQAEIDSRFMELPADRKGETWRIGDTFTFGDGGGKMHTCTVSGIGDGELFFYYDDHAASSKHRHFKASKLQHSKPRTVEDVLNELLDDYMNDVHRDDEDIIAKYASELQMRGDAR